MILRPYQIDTVKEAYATWRNGFTRILLQMPCGSGKTVVFCQIMKDVLSKGKASLMVVRGKSLVAQTARRLNEQGITTNIYQGQNTKNNDAMISIASIQTLYSRKSLPEFDLLVVDEAHNSRGKSYAWLFEHSVGKKTLCVTATPYHKKGMRHCADIILYPIGITKLQELGHLVSGRYFAVQKPDLRGVKKIGDDYDLKQLSKKMESILNGDYVKEWKEKANGRPTIIFTVSIQHSLAVCKLYNDSGIITEHVDADTPDEVRLSMFNRLKSGEINAISNVGILTTGIDIPEVSCLQVARPTMSKALWHQMLGRATRTSEGKENFIVLDHSNNTMKHGMIEDEELGNLDPLPKKKKKLANGLVVHECPTCLAMFHSWPCPNCGEEKASGSRDLKINKDADLVELTSMQREIDITREIVTEVILLRQNKYRCKFRLMESLGQKRGEQIFDKVVLPMRWGH